MRDYFTGLIIFNHPILTFPLKGKESPYHTFFPSPIMKIYSPSFQEGVRGRE
jgi:hypothetical protein